MACDCTTYECLNTVINLNQCRETIELVLEADETGSWIYSYEFNERWFGGSVDVVDGENIELPYTFNEHYVHKIKFFKTDGNLLNDTCYTLDTSKIVGSYSTPTASVQENIFNITVSIGNTFSSSKINGIPVMVVFDGNQSYNRQPDNFTQVGNTVTMTNGVVFYEGQIITVTLKH